jgi:hypothetical protein
MFKRDCHFFTPYHNFPLYVSVTLRYVTLRYSTSTILTTIYIYIYMNMNMNICITTNRVTMIMLMCHASRISQPHMSHITSYQCTSTMWWQQRQSLTKSTPTCTCTCTCTYTCTCKPKFHIMNKDKVIHFKSRCSIRAPCPNTHRPKRSFTYPGCTHITFTIIPIMEEKTKHTRYY